jgi:hypothetical protein
MKTFLTSILDGGEWSTSRPGRFTHRKRAPGTLWIGGWVGHRAGLDTVKKRKMSCPCRESNPGRPAPSPSLYRLSCLEIQQIRMAEISLNCIPEVPLPNPEGNYLWLTSSKALPESFMIYTLYKISVTDIFKGFPRELHDLYSLQNICDWCLQRLSQKASWFILFTKYWWMK